MLTGKILSVVADKGFGFIKPVGSGGDVFFHCSVVDAEFSSLKVDQEVEYELDPTADKLRAKVVVAGQGTPRRSGGHSREGRSSARRSVELEYGFVVKLRRRDQQGSISTEKGGHEFWFDSVDVFGKEGFAKLKMGDYVQFVPQENPDDANKPLAKSVKVAKRRVSQQENRLPRQERARGKKPTWRS